MSADSDLQALVEPFALETLRADPNPICICSSALRICFVNAAWTGFGRANGQREDDVSSGLGANLLDVTPSVLRAAYESLFARARESATPVELIYDCSSPTMARDFRMQVVMCPSGGFVVIHSLVREYPRTGVATALDALYRTKDGVVVQCAHCRRVRRVDAGKSWEWVAAFAAEPPTMTSHGLCSTCSDYYYPL